LIVTYLPPTLPPYSGNHEEVGGGGGDSSGATDRGNGEWIFAWPQGMLLSWPLAKLLAWPPAWPPFSWTPARPPFAWSPPAHSPSRATVGHVVETEDEMPGVEIYMWEGAEEEIGARLKGGGNLWREEAPDGARRRAGRAPTPRWTAANLAMKRRASLCGFRFVSRDEVCEPAACRGDDTSSFSSIIEYHAKSANC
jgi:hypothetical protein